MVLSELKLGNTVRVDGTQRDICQIVEYVTCKPRGLDLEMLGGSADVCHYVSLIQFSVRISGLLPIEAY